MMDKQKMVNNKKLPSQETKTQDLQKQLELTKTWRNERKCTRKYKNKEY